MTKRILFLLILSISLMVIACSTDAGKLDLKNGKLGVIYTDAKLEDSEFVVFDQNGKQSASGTIKKMGIFKVERHKQGNLVLPVQFGEEFVMIHPDGQIQYEKTLQFPLLVKEGDGIRISTYNTKFYSGTLEIKQDQDVKRVELEGFLRAANFDEKHVYVFASITDQKTSVIYVINRQTAKVEKRIPLKLNISNDVELHNQHLLVASADETKTLAVISLESMDVKYIELPHSHPDWIFADQQHVYITHQLQNKVTILDAKTYQVLKTIEIEQPIYKAKLEDNQFYVLSQLDGAPQAGMIGIYDVSNWQLKQKIELPKIRNTRVQDLIVLK